MSPSPRPTPSRFCHPVREVAATRTFGSTLGASQAGQPASRPVACLSVFPSRACLPGRSAVLPGAIFRLLSYGAAAERERERRPSFFKGPSDSKATSPPFPSLIRKQAPRRRFKELFCTRNVRVRMPMYLGGTNKIATNADLFCCGR